MKIKQTALMIISIFAFIITGNAQILINDFSDLEPQIVSPMNTWIGGSPEVVQFSQSTGFVSIEPQNGGNPTVDGSLYAVISGDAATPGPSQNFSPYGYVTVTAKVDSGNFAGGFTLSLVDENFNAASTASFSSSAFTASFTTFTVQLEASGEGGDITKIQYYRIQGSGESSNDFRVSFDNAVATSVPEPGTYALFGLGGVVVFVACRRKYQKA